MLRPALFFSLSHLASAAYNLQDEYMASDFFSKFNFFTGQDPTQGYVNYVDQNTAQQAGIMAQDGSSVSFGVDTQSMNPKDGRMSIRIESKASYNAGSLMIVDLAHMPGSTCGTWPAFWTIGPDWPANGEIDIIEGVNSQKSNAMALHTAPGCTLNANPVGITGEAMLYSGKIKTSDCDVAAPNQATNEGCGFTTQDEKTYGDGFNEQGGGVYATEWSADAISIYHFSRSSVPMDIQNGSPDPRNWGQPLAVFSGCDYRTAIANQTILFDTTFCGQWAGQKEVWEADPVCSQKAATCQDYVANNPGDFANSYWQVNSLRVYQQSDSPSQPPGGPGSPGQQPPYPPGSPPNQTEQPGPPRGPNGPGYSQGPSTFSTMTSAPGGGIRSTSTAVVTVDMTTTVWADYPKETGGTFGAQDVREQPPDDCTAESKQGCISLNGGSQIWEQWKSAINRIANLANLHGNN